MPISLDASGIVRLDLVHESELDWSHRAKLGDTPIDQVGSADLVFTAMSACEVDETDRPLRDPVVSAAPGQFGLNVLGSQDREQIGVFRA